MIEWALAVDLAVAAGGIAVLAHRWFGAGAAPARRAPSPVSPPMDGPRNERGQSLQLPGRRAVGYVRVDPDAIAQDLATYRTVIVEWAAANEMRLIKIVHDVERGHRQREPGPALRWALEHIASGEADVLVTAKLEHLSATVADLPPILEWFRSRRRTLIAIDFGLDTATETGRCVASALSEVAGWERHRLSARTRRGLEAARARGSGGGRPAVADVPELTERIARMREQGMTLQAIADVLNDEGVATLRGGTKWRPSSVQRAAGYRRPPASPPVVGLPAAAASSDAADARAPRSG